MEDNCVIEMCHITKVFPGIIANDDITLGLRKAEIHALLGENGAGKSTLLRSINRLHDVTSGDILIDGKSITSAKGKNLRELRRNIGMIFQNFNLVKRSSVLRNVLVGRVAYYPTWKTTFNLFSKEDKQKAYEALQQVDLADKVYARADELSGGQQQRVSIARALVYEPEVIYFDEPTSALDPELIGEVLTTMKQLAESGMTMVVVTHELSFAKNISNKVLFLDKGEVIENTDSKSFFENPTNDRVKQFLKSISERV